MVLEQVKKITSEGKEVLQEAGIKTTENLSHSQTLSLNRNLQSIIKMLFFSRVNRKTNSNHFENFFRTLSSSAVKLHCVDVVPLDVDKNKVNTWRDFNHALLLFFPAYQFAIKD